MIHDERINQYILINSFVRWNNSFQESYSIEKKIFSLNNQIARLFIVLDCIYNFVSKFTFARRSNTEEEISSKKISTNEMAFIKNNESICRYCQRTFIVNEENRISLSFDR